MDQDVHYLAAKKRIDDRSLNPRVWDAVWDPLKGQPVRVVELGAGIGTMIERVLDWTEIRHIDYTALDINSELLAEAKQRLTAWGRRRGFVVNAPPNGLELSSPDRSLLLQTVEADVRQDLPAEIDGGFDVVIACAFLDLVDLDALIPEILGLLADEGVFYFPINFDGVTTFLPATDPVIDRAIERSYHRSMDQRDGDPGSTDHSHTGRRLLELLPSLGAEIRSAGSSDWIVHPTAGSYHPDERWFLGWMLESVEQSVRPSSDLTATEIERWLAARRSQLSAGSLSLVTHQIDVCGTVLT